MAPRPDLEAILGDENAHLFGTVRMGHMHRFWIHHLARLRFGSARRPTTSTRQDTTAASQSNLATCRPDRPRKLSDRGHETRQLATRRGHHSGGPGTRTPKRLRAAVF